MTPIDPVDRHAAEARAAIGADRYSRGSLIARAGAAAASRPLVGDPLIDALVEMLAPTYGQDNAELAKDDVLRRFIRDGARLVAVRMADLGLALHRRAAQ